MLDEIKRRYDGRCTAMALFMNLSPETLQLHKDVEYLLGYINDQQKQ